MTYGPGVHEITIDFEGAPLRYTLAVPQTLDAVPLVVALHFAGTVTPFYGRRLIDALVGPALAELGPVIVAPDARDGDWAVPGNERAVIELTRAVMASYLIDPRRVLLTGFSMGARGTWHLGRRHQDLFTAAIAVAGRTSDGPDWTIPLLVIHSQDDEVVPLGPTRQMVEELRANGAPVELRVLTGLTHYETERYAEPLRQAIPWLRRVWT